MIQLFLFIFVLCFSDLSASMKELRNEGKKFGEQQGSLSCETIKKMSTDGLIYSNVKEATLFDSEKAKKALYHNERPSASILDFLTSTEVQKNSNSMPLHPEELFLKRSEEIASNAEAHTNQTIEEEKGDYYIEKCQLSGAPSVVTAIRNLSVNVINKSEEVFIKICNGHKEEEEHFWKSNAKRAEEKLKKKFREDATIKDFEVWVSGGGTFSHYKVKSRWTHIDDCEKCQSFKKQSQIRSQLEDAEDKWDYEGLNDLDLFANPDFTLVSQDCLDANSSKWINGKEIFRQCWKEKLTFFHFLPQNNNCAFLSQHNCEQVQKQCVKDGPLGCCLWQLIFRCFKKITRKITNDGKTDFLGVEDIQVEYELNNSYSEVIAKLAVLEEIQKDLKNSQGMDVTKIEIFKGKKMECSKSIASNLIYDCCFNYKGLAKQVGLAKCTSEELILADMQEQGLCHYVGVHEEKKLGIKVKDIHVFCSYPSKLSRVFHEKARKQLNKDWGTPSHPNCGGLTIDEISKINFSKLDLSEAFDQVSRKLPENFKAKLEAFQNRLREDLEKERRTL
jgi:conjugal transfer mating pair stabilization protein TraN